MVVGKFGFCRDDFVRRITATCIIAVSFLFIAIALSLLCDHAKAGTETGEFCPDCPDWQNTEGWRTQEDAYNRAHHLGPYAGTANIKNIDNGNKANGNSVKVEQPQANEYPAYSIITHSGSSMKGLAIIDVRSPQEYRRGHISGARNIYWKSLAPEDAFDPIIAEHALREAGINNTDKILVYGGSDEGASFMFWALSYLGHKNLSRLDCSADAGWSAGLKPSTSLPVVKESNYTIHIIPNLLVNESNLETFLKRPDIQIFDARSFVDYGLSKLTDRSMSFQPSDLYDGARVKDAKALKDVLDRHGLNSTATLLVYGTPQAYDLFYGLTLMGCNATLLEGDWWSETRWAVSKVEKHQ
ncbi:MAG: sulfurtransferase [Methanotrichaceae archaeon]